MRRIAPGSQTPATVFGVVIIWCALTVVSRAVLAAPTGAASESIVANGDFEQADARERSRPAGWYYVQQAQLVDDDGAIGGGRFLRFENRVPGRAAQAQQHVRLDGRQVRAIDVSAIVATRDVEPGQALAEQAAVQIHFYDADDVEIGAETLGPWAGTRASTRESTRIGVPERTRLMLVEIGLRGATGRADFDDVQIVPAEQNPTALPRRISK
jgi:protein-L-isoaspartate(D-aspartate) O-methyltransferase